MAQSQQLLALGASPIQATADWCLEWFQHRGLPPEHAEADSPERAAAPGQAWMLAALLSTRRWQYWHDLVQSQEFLDGWAALRDAATAGRVVNVCCGGLQRMLLHDPWGHLCAGVVEGAHAVVGPCSACRCSWGGGGTCIQSPSSLGGGRPGRS